MAKTHKRVLSLMLSLVMVLSLLPIQAWAIGETYNDKATAIAATGVTANKTVSGPDGDGWYTITLSVQGNTTTTPGVKNLPADVVLVVDTSTSMETKVDSYVTCGGKVEEGWRNWYCSSCWQTYSADEAERNGYICTNQVQQNRLDVAKAAATQFATGLMTASNQVRVGVYDFSGSNRTNFGLSSDLTSVLGTISGLSTPRRGDGTDYGLGLSGAQGILGASEPGRAKFVVFLSDGEPQSGNNGTYQAAALQQSGVTIMTVGIDMDGYAMYYLQNISSKDSSGNYYCYSASSDGSSGAALSTVLALIQEKIEDTVHSGTNAVMTDYVNTSQFDYRVTDPRLSDVDGSGTLTWNIGTIGSGMQSVSFQVKPKAGNYGTLYTNTDVTLGFNSSQQNNQWVTIGKGAIGDPTVNVAAPTYSYTVNYYKDSVAAGNLVDSTSDSAEEGTLIPYDMTVPSTLVGYTFGSVTPENPTVSSTGDNVVNVVFVKDTTQTRELTYYVQYYKDGAAADKDTITEYVWVGSNVIPVDTGKINTTNKYPGYRFDAETTGTIPATIQANGIINVYYVADTYTVKYDKNASDATGVMADQIFTCGAGGQLNANAFSRPNYTFQGWATSSVGEVVYADQYQVTTDLAAAGGSITLYAVWTEQTATINYVAKEGGSVTLPSETVNLATGNVQGSTAAASTGYYFVGWYDNAECTGTALSTNANYVPARPTTAGTVTYYAKFAPKGAVTITANSDSKTYNGDTQTVTGYIVSGLPENYTVEGLTASGSGKDVNTAGYPVTISGTAVIKDTNGNDVTNQYTVNLVPGTLTITPASVTITVDSKTKEYGENDPTFTGTVTGLCGQDELVVSYSRAAGDEGKENVGDDITITATYTPNDNYTVTVTSGKLTITGKTLTADDLTFTANDKVYDSSTTATGTVGFVTPIEGLTVSAGSMTFADKNVADDKTVTASNLTLSGAAAGNYTLAPDLTLTDEANITPRELTVTVTSIDRMYDGTNVVEVKMGEPAGMIPGDDVIIRSVTTGTVADANAGNGKAVTVTELTLAGTDAGNYALTKIVDNVNITKRNVTLTSAGDSKTYDGTALTNSQVDVSGDGFVEGEGAEYNVTGTQTTVGSSHNTFTYALNSNTLEQNYNITTVEGTLKVLGKVTYDANAGDDTVSGMPTDDNTYELNAPVNTVAGTPIRQNYTFAGWMLSADGTETVTEGTMGETGLTFYAKWTRDTYTVTVQYKYTSDGKTLQDYVFDLPGNQETSFTVNAGEGWTITVGEGTDGTYVAPAELEMFGKAYVFDQYVTPGPMEGDSDDLVVILVYGKDVYGNNDEPDDVPDYYQKMVTYKVYNGAWADESTQDKSQWVTLTDAAGNWSTSGSYTLTEYDVPQPGKANTGYEADQWYWHFASNPDNALGESIVGEQITKSDEATYVYNFKAMEFVLTVIDKYVGGPDACEVTRSEEKKTYNSYVEIAKLQEDAVKKGYTFDTVTVSSSALKVSGSGVKGKMPAENVVVTFTYKPVNSYVMVEHRYVGGPQDTNPTMPENFGSNGILSTQFLVEENQYFDYGDAVSFPALTEEDLAPGYVFSEYALLIWNDTVQSLPFDETTNSFIGTMPVGPVHIVFYYAPRTDLSYTVKYVDKDTNTEIAPSKTVDGQTFGTEVTETAIDIEGYALDDVNSKAITIDVEDNEIIFYYAKDVKGGGDDGDEGDDIPDKYQVFVKYVATEGGSLDGATYKAYDLRDAEGNLATSVTLTFPTPVAATNYIFDDWTNPAGVTVDGTTMSDFTAGETYTFTANFDKDVLTDPTEDKDPDKPGDGIADKYQVVVNYQAVNGTVSFASTVVTKKDASGNPAENGTAKLAAAHIPATSPYSGYVISSKPWTPVTPVVGMEVKNGDTFVVTYVYIPPYIPPTDPGTDIEDPDVPLADLPGLNTVDHYAYIAGYEDGTVRPNNNITRAEVATIFFRLFTDEYRETYWSTNNPFSDVAYTAWYNNAVSTTSNAGIIAGYPDGTFQPNNYITRAEFATIAARFISEEYVGPDLFTDISGHWAAEYINRAANAGWINGYPDGSFDPDAYITRAEAMTLVNSMLGRMPHKDHMLENMVKWPDNPEAAWYYEAVQEATNGHDYDWYEEEDQRLYEIWTALQPNRDWEALEKEWSNAYSAPGGEVIG